MLIYTAGCIGYYDRNGTLEKADDWREMVRGFLIGFNVVDSYKIKPEIFNPVTNYKLEKNSSNDSLAVRQNDLFMNKSDIMLVNLTDLDQSPGTIYELVYFSKVLGRPIIAFGENKFKDSPHIQDCISKTYDKLDDAMTAIYNLFLINNVI